MMFAIAAFLRPGAEEKLIDHHEEVNEFLGGSSAQVKLAGALRDEGGRRIGYLAIFDGTQEQASEWAKEDPIAQADLYQDMEIYLFEDEVGGLG